MAPHPEPPVIRIDTSVATSDSGVDIPSPVSHRLESSEKKETPPSSAVSNYSNLSSQPTLSPLQVLEQARQDDSAISLDNKPFKLTPKQLTLLNHHEQQAVYILHEIGGITGLEQKINCNIESGLSADEDFSVRESVYGRNVLPDKKSIPFWRLFIMALSDKMLILLSVAAIVSFALGMYETFGTPPEYDATGHEMPKVDWIEGVAILVAVLVVVSVGALNDWQKERQFAKLNKKKDDRQVKVIRSGQTATLSVYDIEVGDCLLIEPGDMVPVDGVFIKGHGVQCDESAATGETNALKKVACEEVVAAIDKAGPSGLTAAQAEKLDPFILSGSKVLEGFGTFLVTAVGVNSAHGKTMMDLQNDDNDEGTPLQAKLNVIAETIAKWGGGASLLLFIILLLRFLGELPSNHETSAKKGEEFLGYLITAVTLIAVAVPEGLPLAVTLALAFATKRMLKDNNLVRVLKSCETMGNATTICSDKTGTLTQNKMTVVEGAVGLDLLYSSKDSANLPADTESEKELLFSSSAGPVPITTVQDGLDPTVKTILLQSISFNTTAFEDSASEEVFVGSKTETALLNFARNYLAMGPLDSERSNLSVVQLFPFDSKKKCMGVAVRLPDPNNSERTFVRLYVKGASEIVLAQASSAVVATKSSTITSVTMTDIDGVVYTPIDNHVSDYVNKLIVSYAEKSLRTIGMVYRDFPSWPPEGLDVLEDEPNQIKNFGDVTAEMRWVGLVGIMDPLRNGVVEAVLDCQRAGVVVRMVTGDNIVTAKAIATDCGIYTNGVVLQGPDFRAMDPEERDRIIPKLQVLARSSPQDKRLLVQRLKKMGETVAVTGDGTNDAPALTMADVGFSMGIAGTEVAKEASDIILMDDNFSSIVKALLWGRAVNDAVKKFLQFQVTVNITAVTLTIISAIVSSDGDSVMTAVQLLWVNLIMDTFAALALATDPPTRSMLDRPPVPKSEGMITLTMWKMMIGQAIYQIAATFVLHFAGNKIWNIDPNDSNAVERLSSTVFNSFVWMQFFNMFVNRRLDNKLNIFEGLSRNYFFIMIACVMGGGQILIMFVGGSAFSIKRITGVDWAVSLVIGFVSIPIGIFLRLCVPDALAYTLYKPFGIVFRFVWGLIVKFFKLFAFLWPFKKNGDDGDEEHKLDEDGMIRSPGGTQYEKGDYEWNPAIEKVREELIFLKAIRGGRSRELRFKPKKIYQQWKASRSSISGIADEEAHGASRSGSIMHHNRRRSGSSLGAMAMVPSIVGGAVAGWSPSERSPSGTMFPGATETPDGYLSPVNAGGRTILFDDSRKTE
ncbi:uncharacterized protein V1516DRAFT_575259 [Lipomyces oligophaga]|uniref:uncharacterized protein n=1 Tax=Lipomyces oligophaga TaxID=45792 RepID=UPI0034CE4858